MTSEPEIDAYTRIVAYRPLYGTDAYIRIVAYRPLYGTGVNSGIGETLYDNKYLYTKPVQNSWFNFKRSTRLGAYSTRLGAYLTRLEAYFATLRSQ